MTTQISTALNKTAPDLSNSRADARKFFNNYFALDFSIGSANDAITAFFESYTGNPASGRALAASVLYTAQAQNLDPMQVMSDFQKLTPNELNNYLAAFLNLNRVPTSTIGIKKTSTTNSYITRSILP
jgi:hypothetical protein